MDERIIKARLDQLHARSITARWPAGPWEARTAEHVAPGQYHYDGDWMPIDGETSWPALRTLFLRANVQPPAGVPQGDLYLEFAAEGLEGLLSVNGRPYAGIDANHPRVVMPGDGPLALSAEFMCLGAALHTPDLRREHARLRSITFAQVDRDLLAAWYDFTFAWEAGKEARDERRRTLLAAALEDALMVFDLTAPAAEFSGQIAEARALLAGRIGNIAPDPEGGRVFLTGHTHIDTAWLWPLRETVRKCGRTFATACRLMERYPDFRFSCSQPQLYAYTKQYYPELFEEIRHWVSTGRWECTGGMWVEPDCNVPSGESLIRQIMHGVRFFQQEFGVTPRSCWLPDVFGYPASLPQILKGCGLDYFMTAKLHWQARNPFPMHLFQWEGIDGTRVLTHIPRLKSYYNGWPRPFELAFAWENYLQKVAYSEVMLPFGYGDGGGGVTEEMLEYTGRAASYPGLPATRQGTEEAYFDDVARAGADLPVWSGELYLETHRGTYTTQAAIKRANRLNELRLRDAEIFGSLAALQGAPVDLTGLNDAWQNLLLLQFHDILPGSSIGEIYREASVDHVRIGQTARTVRDAAVGMLAGTSANRAAEGGIGPELVVFNSLSWPRGDVATARIPAVTGPLELAAPDGSAVAAQVVAASDGEATVVFSPAEVPAAGYARLRLRPASQPAATSLVVSARRLENRFYLIELGDDGTITRLFDKRCDREVVPPGRPANELQLFQDGPEREAAWNIHATYEKRAYQWDPGVEIAVIEQGPVRAAVRVTRCYRGSRVEQDIVIYDRVPRIDFPTRVHWEERQVMLKAAFPVLVRSPRATYEVQFGAVERPTHRNTSWDQEKFEVAAQSWADLSEAGYGVSLLNDCKYGYDIKGDVLRLTLLRGAQWPDPHADEGDHVFTYALLPHSGDWIEGQTVRRTWELNAPAVCVTRAAADDSAPATAAFFQIDGPAILQALKPAEDGDGWVLRLYEPHGSRGTVSVRTPRPLAAVIECNHVEAPRGEVPPSGDAFAFAILPFEIKTFRLRFAAAHA
jgi:alpha-mannosidase